MFVRIYVYYVIIRGFYNMVVKHNTFISSLETSDTSQAAYKMKDLNPMYFAVLDHKDQYYSMEEIKPYIDMHIILNRYTYDTVDGEIKETKNSTKSNLKDCKFEDF